MHSNRQFLVYFKSGAGHRSRWRNLLGIRGNVLRKGNKKTICLKFGHLLTVKLDFWATGALQRLQQMLFIMEVLTSLPNGNLISVLQMFFWEGLDCRLRSFFDIKDNTLLLWKYAWLYIATCSYISKSKPTNIKALSYSWQYNVVERGNQPLWTECSEKQEERDVTCILEEKHWITC